MPPREAVQTIVGCPAHKAMAREISEKAVTLVKSKQDVFPLTPEKYPRILIVPVKGTNGGGIFSVITGHQGPSVAEKVQKRLEARGFQVRIYEEPLTKNAGEKAAGGGSGPGRGPGTGAQSGGHCHAVFCREILCGELCERTGPGADAGPGQRFRPDRRAGVLGHEQGRRSDSVVRPRAAGGGGQHEHPFLLADVPQARTYINAYDANDSTLDALVEKLCGESAFEGVDPVDAFCGMWDTKV